MKWDKPKILKLNPLTNKMALEGMSFIEATLGLTSDISGAHPIRLMHKQAKQHQADFNMTWGSSREFNLLAFWGVQLRMVQDWPNLNGLIERVKNDKSTWDAHLHEASVASMFRLAGCEGEFLDVGNEGGPDLKVRSGSHTALVECKRSKPLTTHERKNREIWFPAASQVLSYLKNQIPAAVIRFYPVRDAIPDDPSILLSGIERAIERSNCALMEAIVQ